MKKKDSIACLILLMPAIAGYFIGGYTGGLITGVFACFILGVLHIKYLRNDPVPWKKKPRSRHKAPLVAKFNYTADIRQQTL